jgi:hypothetical protein
MLMGTIDLALAAWEAVKPYVLAAAGGALLGLLFAFVVWG